MKAPAGQCKERREHVQQESQQRRRHRDTHRVSQPPTFTFPIIVHDVCLQFYVFPGEFCKFSHSVNLEIDISNKVHSEKVHRTSLTPVYRITLENKFWDFLNVEVRSRTISSKEHLLFYYESIKWDLKRNLYMSVGAMKEHLCGVLRDTWDVMSKSLLTYRHVFLLPIKKAVERNTDNSCEQLPSTLVSWAPHTLTSPNAWDLVTPVTQYGVYCSLWIDKSETDYAPLIHRVDSGTGTPKDKDD